MVEYREILSKLLNSKKYAGRFVHLRTIKAAIVKAKEALTSNWSQIVFEELRKMEEEGLVETKGYGHLEFRLGNHNNKKILTPPKSSSHIWEESSNTLDAYFSQIGSLLNQAKQLGDVPSNPWIRCLLKMHHLITHGGSLEEWDALEQEILNPDKVPKENCLDLIQEQLLNLSEDLEGRAFDRLPTRIDAYVEELYECGQEQKDCKSLLIEAFGIMHLYVMYIQSREKTLSQIQLKGYINALENNEQLTMGQINKSLELQKQIGVILDKNQASHQLHLERQQMQQLKDTVESLENIIKSVDWNAIISNAIMALDAKEKENDMLRKRIAELECQMGNFQGQLVLMCRKITGLVQNNNHQQSADQYDNINHRLERLEELCTCLDGYWKLAASMRLDRDMINVSASEIVQRAQQILSIL